MRGRSLSRPQILALLLIAVLSLGLEGLIVFTLLQSGATAATYQYRGNGATAVRAPCAKCCASRSNRSTG